MAAHLARAILVLAVFPPPGSAAGRDAVPDLRGVERGTGTIGDWILAWRYDGFGDAENHFRAVMGDERPFPHCAAVIGGRNRELVFFDGDGNVAEKIRLQGDEDALPCADGAAYLAWSPHSTSRRLLTYRYHLRGNPEPQWEASAVGLPLLFSPDGSLFVIASADTGHDGFQRMLTHPGGRVQVVDASGGVLGELPIRPSYVRLTGDRARIAMLHAEELVVLRADGRLDWNVEVPVDALLQREGLSQLEAAGGVIVITGTGESDDSTALRPKRRGTIQAFDDSGRLLWRESQPDGEPLWFQVSCALSPDGGTLATFHTDARELVVQVWDARRGEPLWRRAVPRSSGGRRCYSGHSGMSRMIHLSVTNIPSASMRGPSAGYGSVPSHTSVPSRSHARSDVRRSPHAITTSSPLGATDSRRP
ncbi:hypothetical protein K8I85_11565, partial [bacterium]|nr:hypothetical protein [bacterium]